jgi:hypothetical protein
VRIQVTSRARDPKKTLALPECCGECDAHPTSLCCRSATHIARARRRRPQLCHVRCDDTKEDLAFPCPRAAAVWRYSIQVFVFIGVETERFFARRRVTPPRKDPVRAQEKWPFPPPTVRKPCGFLVVCHLAPRSRHWPSPLTHQDAASDRARLVADKLRSSPLAKSQKKPGARRGCAIAIAIMGRKKRGMSKCFLKSQRFAF